MSSPLVSLRFFNYRKSEYGYVQFGIKVFLIIN